MAALSFKDARTRYALAGIAFGFCFPIIATLFDAYVRDLGLGIGGLMEAQRTQPLHWIIDTAPIFLGFFSCLAGIKQQEVVRANEGLERKVQQRTEMLHEQNEELRTMQDELEDSLLRISQSINYAQRIQDAIISSTQDLEAAFPDSFVMYRPRDVVSGDFPWYIRKGDHHYIAAVDCTGHGVPGAFMSLIGYFLLNRIVDEHDRSDTGVILDQLHKQVVNVLNQESNEDVHDGMDLSLFRYDASTGEVMYSGACNPIYHVRDEDLMEYKGDFWSVGGTQFRKRKPYRTQTFTTKKGDLISIFSDGITDQFSADGERKFGYRRIKKHLTAHSAKPLAEVHGLFETEMDEWMGNERQLDDMLFITIRL